MIVYRIVCEYDIGCNNDLFISHDVARRAAQRGLKTSRASLPEEQFLVYFEEVLVRDE